MLNNKNLFQNLDQPKITNITREFNKLQKTLEQNFSPVLAFCKGKTRKIKIINPFQHSRITNKIGLDVQINTFT